MTPSANQAGLLFTIGPIEARPPLTIQELAPDQPWSQEIGADIYLAYGLVTLSGVVASDVPNGYFAQHPAFEVTDFLVKQLAQISPGPYRYILVSPEDSQKCPTWNQSGRAIYGTVLVTHAGQIYTRERVILVFPTTPVIYGANGTIHLTTLAFISVVKR